MRICLRGEGESEWEIETAKRSIHAGAIVFSVFIHSFIRSIYSFVHVFLCICFHALETGIEGQNTVPAVEEGQLIL